MSAETLSAEFIFSTQSFLRFLSLINKYLDLLRVNFLNNSSYDKIKLHVTFSLKLELKSKNLQQIITKVNACPLIISFTELKCYSAFRKQVNIEYSERSNVIFVLVKAFL